MEPRPVGCQATERVLTRVKSGEDQFSWGWPSLLGIVSSKGTQNFFPDFVQASFGAAVISLVSFSEEPGVPEPLP